MVTDGTTTIPEQLDLPKRVKVVNPDLLRALGRSRSSTLAIPFGQTDVRGVVTVLEQSFITRLMKKNPKGPFTYFLVSGIGHGVFSRWSCGESQCLYIFLPSARDSEQGAIVGKARICEVKKMKSSQQVIPKMWREFMSPALTQAELLAIARTMNDRPIWVLTCADLQLSERSVGLTLSDIKSLEHGSYYVSQIDQQFRSCVYVGPDLSSRLLRLFPEPESKPFNVVSEIERMKMPVSVNAVLKSVATSGFSGFDQQIDDIEYQKSFSKEARKKGRDLAKRVNALTVGAKAPRKVGTVVVSIGGGGW
jgi:hypothetical protein